MCAFVTSHPVLGTEQVIKHIGDPACPGQWETKGPCGVREGMMGPGVGVQCGTNPVFAAGCEGSTCSAHNFLDEQDGTGKPQPVAAEARRGLVSGQSRVIRSCALLTGHVTQEMVRRVH